MKHKIFVFCLLISLAASLAAAQTLSFTSVPTGYKAGSIDLGYSFTGALAADPADSNIVYASVGGWQNAQVARIDLSDSSVTIAASGLFGSIGGLAVPGPNQLIIVDNDDYSTSPIPGETVLLCEDLNTDGDFDDAGEISELLAPILVDGGFYGFTGAQARIAPAGDPSGIPSGSLLYQNADGSALSDLFVVTDPTSSTTAAYRPTGDAWCTGFDFNGGFDFDSAGRVFMGAGNASYTGEVFLLENLNSDEDIDADEISDVVSSATLTGGISDLIIDGEDDVFIVTNPWGGSQVQSFDASAATLSSDIVPTDFANTDSGWLTTVMINSRSLGFEGGTDGGATLVLGGYTVSYANATNLLTLTPEITSGVADWILY